MSWKELFKRHSFGQIFKWKTPPPSIRPYLERYKYHEGVPLINYEHKAVDKVIFGFLAISFGVGD